MTKKLFATADMTAGVLNALVKNMMAQLGVKDPDEAIRIFNAGEYYLARPGCSWYKRGGVIYITVISDGTTRSGWVRRIEENEKISDEAKDLLNLIDFVPTTGVKYEVAVLNGGERPKRAIDENAKQRGLTVLNPEVALLLYEKLNRAELKSMGLRGILICHHTNNKSMLFFIKNEGGYELDVAYGIDEVVWEGELGCAYAASVE